MNSVDRRGFLIGAAAFAAGLTAKVNGEDTSANKELDVYFVPNFHPASCGWLTNFSRERVYCANSYFDHLDRVRDDPNYSFVLSEVNNIIAMMNFHPERIPELKQRVREGRVELVNGFFLESTVNLSGGEALVRLGIEGLRWHSRVFGIEPRFAWTIDVCGTHDQMAQITSGLGFEAMVYTRSNPTGKTIHWSVSPDGSKVLSFCPGGYSEENDIFKTEAPLTDKQLAELEASIANRRSTTPANAPVLILAGSGDYSVAPRRKQYPSELLQQWKSTGFKEEIAFTTFSQYVGRVRPGIESGAVQIPSMHGGTGYQFDAFWIENNEVKTRFRANEHALASAESLSTIASLTAGSSYPVQTLHNAWILTCLSMDRNTLWGSAGGMVFVSDQSWDVNDRLSWVSSRVLDVLKSSGNHLLPSGLGLGLFNSLNWDRNDPVEIELPSGKSLAGIKSELLPSGKVLCQPELPSVSIAGLALAPTAPGPPENTPLPGTIETPFYRAVIDPRSGNLTSLKLTHGGHELLGGAANVLCAERPKKKEQSPADFMAPHPEREVIGTSEGGTSAVECQRGPVAYTVTVNGTFLGKPVRRTIRFYHQHPRIDFVTELNDTSDYTVVTAQFPLVSPVLETRRGIPFGISHSGWSQPNPDLHGWNKGIVPAVRWTDYSLADDFGISLFDRGISGRELDGQLAMIYLLNAEDQYHGYPNPWLTGAGRHICEYAIVPRAAEWASSRTQHMAWEYNQPPIAIGSAAVTQARSFLYTSPNVIVEALRREAAYVELRVVECLGQAGTATVRMTLPHGSATLVDLRGRKLTSLPKSDTYQVSMRPQQIVTMHFEAGSTIEDPKPITQWDQFVPEAKSVALHQYQPGLKGHPPTGDGIPF
jgi:alpha-mannosidase